MTKKDLGNATNEKIEDLNLIALRKYACPKINAQKDWYLKCMECQGLESCRVGKRAIDIIESETKPKTQIEKFDERMLKTIEAKERTPRNAVYFDALRTDDPVGYVFEHLGYKTRGDAKSKLIRFLKGHNIPTDFKTSRQRSLENLLMAATSKTERVRKRMIDIFEGAKTTEEKMWRFLTSEKENGSKASGNGMSVKLYKYAKDFTDLDAKYDFRSVGRVLAKVENSKLFVDELLKKYFPNGAPEKELPEPATDDDQVSLEDFLKENEICDPEGNFLSVDEAKEVFKKKLDEQDQAKKKGILADFADNPDRPAPHVRPITDIPNPNAPKETRLTVVGQEKVIPTNAQLVLRQEFGRKKQEHRKRIDYVREEINKLLKIQEEIVEQMEALDKAAVLFGMRATDLSQQKQAT